MPKKSLPAANDGDECKWTPARWEALYRSTCDFWKFWEICDEKPCKRAHRCAGDVHLCRAKHLQLVSPEAKFWLRTVLDARIAGASVEEASRAGEEILAEMGITGDIPAVRIPDTPPQPLWPVEPGRCGR